LLHRKWTVIAIWLVAGIATFIIAFRLPDIYTSDTVILVDPQKVPEAYVKSTVTGDVRNRLGTLKQQILSATRLQRIIENLNLYPEERKQGVAREDLITRMRSDISVSVVSDFGASQDLQAFRIAYSGKDPRLVAQVTNELATLFINENLKAREQQATGTTEFLDNQLQETRRKLEEQEAKLMDFKLKHVGEMPKQEAADLQLLAQVQQQLQLEGDALSRAEQQQSYIQSMIAQSSPVVDVDEGEAKASNAPDEKGGSAAKSLAVAKARLTALLSRYSEKHPDVVKLQRQIQEEEAKQAKEALSARASESTTAVTAPVKRVPRPPVDHFNPVLQSQLRGLDTEINKHKEERQRLTKLVATYRAKLDAIPINEQRVTELERDYEISKSHYSQLLEKQLSAKTATQLEIRQKGEKFEPLDVAQPAERPSRPNRLLINLAGNIAGLVIGFLLAIGKDFVTPSIITSQDMSQAANLPILGEIPVIQTLSDRRTHRKRLLLAMASAVVVAIACGAMVFYRYHAQF
jgi:polysaccharide chain length determinant protein (PEP-CTERM system associated)